MAYETPGFCLGTLVADNDLSAKQFHAMKVTSTGMDQAVAGDVIGGILQENPLAGQVGAIMVNGITKAVAGGAFSAGDKLEVNVNGRLIVATATAGYHLVAVALEASLANGNIVAVLLKDLGKQ